VETKKRKPLVASSFLLSSIRLSVSGTVFEKIVIGLDIVGQIDNFTGLELLDAIEHYGFAVMIGSFVVAGQALTADVLTATGFKGTGYFIFGEDGFIGALWNASAAINACIGIDIHPGPFFDRFTRDDALDRTHLDATAVA